MYKVAARGREALASFSTVGGVIDSAAVGEKILNIFTVRK